MKPPASSAQDSAPERLVGKSVRELVALWGNPDRIDPGDVFSAKFTTGTYAVVFTYRAKNTRVYVTTEATVLGVTEIKE